MCLSIQNHRMEIQSYIYMHVHIQPHAHAGLNHALVDDHIGIIVQSIRSQEVTNDFESDWLIIEDSWLINRELDWILNSQNWIQTPKIRRILQIFTFFDSLWKWLHFVFRDPQSPGGSWRTGTHAKRVAWPVHVAWYQSQYSVIHLRLSISDLRFSMILVDHSYWNPLYRYVTSCPALSLKHLPMC
jgi:hypothetical protein